MVDLNRNFPTRDWESSALDQWKTHQKSNVRRYPGTGPGSEAETKCAIAHISDFRPDIVVSIHTPYGLFDYDGPPEKKIQTKLLPWSRLGTYPGSLGRYLWDERSIPVLTIELKPDSLQEMMLGFISFQDSISDLVSK
jgi:protein MpaA